MHASETAISKENAAIGKKELEKANQEAVKASNLKENAAKRKLGLPGFTGPACCGPKLTRGHLRKTGTKLVPVLTKKLGSGNFTGEQKPKKRKDRANSELSAIQQNLACEKHMEDAKSVIEEVAKKLKIVDDAKGPNEDEENTKQLLQQAEDATDTMAMIAIGQHVVALKSQVAPNFNEDGISADALAPLLPIQAPPDLQEQGVEEPAKEDVPATEEVLMESVDEDVLISRGADDVTDGFDVTAADGTVAGEDLSCTPLSKMRQLLPKPCIFMDPVHGRVEEYSQGQVLDPISGEAVFVDNRPNSALLPSEKRNESAGFTDEDDDDDLDDFDKDVRALHDDDDDDEDGDDDSCG